MKDKSLIYSGESMIEMIRELGIVPLFRSGVPGYSIEEMTSPDCWFTTSDQLGPWDWKVEAVQQGDIVYGKILGGKAAFATLEWYQHLMNYRRSLPRYRVALDEVERTGKKSTGSTGKKAKPTRSEILMKHLAPVALNYIKVYGSGEARDLRQAISEAVTPALLRALGPAYKANLTPVVKKSISDTVVQFLEMGTWIIAGDIRRVYRGPNLEYHGWQRTSLARPEDLYGLTIGTDNDTSNGFNTGSGNNIDQEATASTNAAHATKTSHSDSPVPSWARRFEEPDPVCSAQSPLSCTPEQSRDILVNHIKNLFPDYEKEILKMVL